MGMVGTIAFVSLLSGFLIGYLVRDRISKARAARYWAGRKLGGSTLRR